MVTVDPIMAGSMFRRVSWVAATFACWAGCADRKSDDTPSQPDVCRVYVECASSATPSEADVLLERYGSEGSCWKGTAEEAALCEDDCIERLDDLREQFPGDSRCEQDVDT